MFLRAEQIVPDLDAAAWATSVVSSRVLTWLGELAESGATIVHMGDYDPVGLSHFLKVRDACGGRASFFSPVDLEERVCRWGKAKLISASAGTFDRLRRVQDPSVMKVVEIIERHTKGLEHEALLLPLTDDARAAAGPR